MEKTRITLILGVKMYHRRTFEIKRTNPSSADFFLSRRSLSGGFRLASFLVVTPRLPYLRLKSLIRKVRRVFLFGSIRATSDNRGHLLVALKRVFPRLRYLLLQGITLNLLPLAFETSVILPLLLGTRPEVYLNWQVFGAG